MSDRLQIDPVPETHPKVTTCPLLSRRQFLQGMAAGATALAATAAGATTTRASIGPASDDAYGMLIDLTRCTGCNACALACKEANACANPTEVPIQLDSDALSYVDKRTVSDMHGNDYAVFIKRQCMHCLHPACASACTVGALKKTAEGPVVYDASKCFGCRYCQYACPFGLPVYEWENPLGLISKCEMCVERLEEGERPACAGACPNGAIRFGKRSTLLAQAHAQIVSNPGRYVNHVYGEHEAGGTSVLYLAPVPFSSLGFPSVQENPIPDQAEWVMKKTPVVAVTVAALAAAFQYMTGRHAHKAHAEFVPETVADASVRPQKNTQGGAQ
jgi:formate dehydrogenase iron-sulfur subunit